MAVTIDLAKRTPNALGYLLTHDGNAGNTFVLTNAIMVADMEAGPIRTVPGLFADLVANDQAKARRAMLGEASSGVLPFPGNILTDFPHCACFVTPRTAPGGAVIVWVVDADVDGVNALRHELNLTAGTQASTTAFLFIKFQHSYDR